MPAECGFPPGPVTLLSSLPLISRSALQTAAMPNVEAKADARSVNAIQPLGSSSIMVPMLPTSVNTSAATETTPATAPAKSD